MKYRVLHYYRTSCFYAIAKNDYYMIFTWRVYTDLNGLPHENLPGKVVSLALPGTPENETPPLQLTSPLLDIPITDERQGISQYVVHDSPPSVPLQP
jgi:hypothetical protein